MIGLSPNGDFLVDNNGALKSSPNPPQQNFISETRCEQGTYSPNITFGRNPIIWTISQSPGDRIDDLTRIGNQYIVVQSITYFNGVFIIQ